MLHQMVLLARKPLLQHTRRLASVYATFDMIGGISHILHQLRGEPVQRNEAQVQFLGIREESMHTYSRLLIATLSLSTVLLPIAAAAQAPVVRTLIEQARAVDAQCRGGDPGDPKTAAACKKRKSDAARLNRLGWCYGKRGQIGADMDWHRCTRSSYRARDNAS